MGGIFQAGEHMKIEHPTKRYKVSFMVDTHLSKKKIVDILGVFDCYMINFEGEE